MLVDSSAILAECLSDGVNVCGATQASVSKAQQLFSSPLARGLVGQALAEPWLLQETRSCTVSMASALLHSDAMPALSRLLSSEAQRGPARALLSPRQLATCLKLVSKLFYTAQKLPSALLDVTSCAEGTRWYGQQQQQHQQQRPSSTVGQNQRPAGSPAASPSRPPSVPQRSTAAFATCTTATPAASPAPSGLAGSGISPATRAAANTRASKGRSRTPRNTGSATVPSPQRQVPTSSTSSSAPPQPPLLATAVLTDVAESGVVEAACTVAVQLLSSRQQGEGTHWSRGDREHLVMGVMDLLYRLVQLVQYAGRQTEIPLGLLASTFTGSCVQVRDWSVADESAVNQLLCSVHAALQPGQIGVGAQAVVLSL